MALAALLAAGQTARPVTLVAEVRAAIAAHDLTRAEAIVAKRRADQGNTAEVLEAASWLGRGALAENKLDQAEKYAIDVQKQIIAALAGRPVDVDPKFATALGATIEVQAQVAAARGARSEAVTYLQRELDNTAQHVDAQAHPEEHQPADDGGAAGAGARSLGIHRSDAAELSGFEGQGRPLFFWAHWCGDCKAQSPVLAKLLEKYQSQGLTIMAPTQRYGYVARGQSGDAGRRAPLHRRRSGTSFYPFLRRCRC